MKLNEIDKLASGVYRYTTQELVKFINEEFPGLGSDLFNHGYFDLSGNQDSVLYQIEQAIEDNVDSEIRFSITDIEETQSGRLWHVIDL